jgi:perosamine synthetase
MVSELTLRRASPDDGRLLYRWRTDPVTRAASHQGGPIDLATHLAWLTAALANPQREIYVAESGGVEVGTVRVDHAADSCELSWTVAPEARGQGVGSRMVALAAAAIPGAIRAEVKPDNPASIRIAEAAGMRLEREEGGILHFRREAVPPARRQPGVREAHGMPGQLAIDGGAPVRTSMLRYATQSLDEADIQAVEAVLRGEWLTTGPAVREFEQALCARSGAAYAVAVNTGTAALHAAAAVAGVGPGDEVIVPAISFVASANCVRYQGGRVVFADLSPDTLNIDPADVERKLTPKTRAIVAVDFAGHPCDHDALRALADARGIAVIEDAAHALGATYHGRRVGTLQRLTTLSFHPVKHITTGEGGAVLTDATADADAVRSFRHHGIDLDLHARHRGQSWEYDVVTLGYNYRIPDINCALGTSQLRRLDGWLARRRQLVEAYRLALSDLAMIELPTERDGCQSAWHLFPIRLHLDRITATRARVFAALRAENIGVNVHYIPIPWMTAYARLGGYARGQWPVAEGEYERLLSLPLYPAMTDRDLADVVDALHKTWEAYRR